jgi:uncharacterized protein
MNSSRIVLDGWWERDGRSLAAAAVTGMLVIGALYFNGQALLAWFTIMIAAGAHEALGGASKPFMTLLDSVMVFLRFIIMLTQFGLMLAPALILVRRGHTAQVRAYVRLRRVSVLEALLPAVVALALLPVNLFLMNALMDALRMPEMFRELNDEFLSADSVPGFLFLLLVIGVTPAICEEVFFRGYVQRTFERLMGWKSIVLVGIIFGLYHMQPLGLFTLSLLGVLFGYYYYRSRSLIPGMIAHLTNNAVVVYLYYAKPTLGGVSLGTISQIPAGWLPGSLAVAISSIALFHSITRATGREEVLERPPEDTGEETDTVPAPSSAAPVAGEAIMASDIVGPSDQIDASSIQGGETTFTADDAVPEIAPRPSIDASGESTANDGADSDGTESAREP